MADRKQIKVLECIRQGQIGGGESHLLSLVENMDRTLFEPVVLSFTEGPMVDRLQAMGVRTEVIHTEKPFDIAKWKKIKQWIKQQNFDLVHAHGTRANSNILWAARKLHLPVVYTIHGWSFHDDQHPLVKKIRILGEKYLTSKSSINISVSKTNKATGEKYFPEFSSTVINNGIDPEKFNPERNFKNIREELKIPEKATVILFLARFTLQKQPVVLLNAFIEAAQNNPDLFLLMVGDGEQKQEALNILEKSNVRDRILILPFRQDVPDVLHAADIFVLASLWEGLPIALLEAMSMGKAIIASNADGTREIIDHMENGYLIDTAHLQENLTRALQVVTSDAALAQRMQIKARQTVKDRFNAINMTQQIENVYKQIVAN